METNQNPATHVEAEELARSAVAGYMAACRAGGLSPEMQGNYLMKLVSVAGLLMASAEGSQCAAERLIGTAGFVLHKMPAKPRTRQ
jgi:hypothetical protein